MTFACDPVYQESDQGSQDPELVREAESEAEPMRVRLAYHLDQE